MKRSHSIALQALLLVVAIFFPAYEFDFDTSIILTAVSLLFTILVGFFIAATTSNYLRLQSILSNEDATLISIYDIVARLDPERSKRIADVIDKYMIALLDYELLDYAVATMPESNQLMAAISEVAPKNKGAEPLIQNLYEQRSNLLSIRHEAIVSSKKIVSKKHWLILILLAVIVAVILLTLRTESPASSLIIGLILVAIYQTLLLLDEIDSNSFLADKFAYQVPQHVFLAIGNYKYFPEIALTPKLKKALAGETYRVGIYDNYPASYSKKIEYVNLKK